MSKIVIALVSFFLGACFSLVLLPGHCLSANAKQVELRNGAQLVGGSGIPIVPPISQHFENFAVLGLNGTAFGVDGIDCVKCIISGPSLSYGGGNFQFRESAFSGPIRVEFTGAARNTVIFLEFLQQLNGGRPPLQPQPTHPSAPGGPIVKTAVVKDTITGSYGTP
jgi:hypothetical protein